jgi:hypothetical protein
MSMHDEFWVGHSIRLFTAHHTLPMVMRCVRPAPESPLKLRLFVPSKLYYKKCAAPAAGSLS